MSGTAGTVALVNGTTALTCSRLRGLPTRVGRPRRLRRRGHQRAAPRAGRDQHRPRSSAPTRPTPTTTALTSPPAPPRPAPPTPACGGGTGDGDPGPLRIHDIQDTSWLAAHDGEQVTNVPGIVTGIRTAGSSRGYWIQDPDPDSTRPPARACSSSPRRPGSPSATRCSCPARSGTSIRCRAATPSRRRRTSR